MNLAEKTAFAGFMGALSGRSGLLLEASQSSSPNIELRRRGPWMRSIKMEHAGARLLVRWVSCLAMRSVLRRKKRLPVAALLERAGNAVLSAVFKASALIGNSIAGFDGLRNGL